MSKADELQYNPHKIYEWVRNNVEFVPTYGSIQGADQCMQTMRCNAFDTSSLLIALLRASDIPARYAMGTIQIPIEAAMNWAGGFTDPNAALRFIASGGIPVGGLTSGGKIVMAQMEHVWVEAWIDYFPSRGARHKPGQGDTWIPLDGSFKQYTYAEGIDIASAVPFDAQTFIDQLQATATINEQEGYATGVDSSYIQQTMQDYKTSVESYMTANHPDSTVGDVLGTKTIVKEEFPFLLGTLPYRGAILGARNSELPATLRHKVSFSVRTDNIYTDTAPLATSLSLPELAGKKLTLSYSPATPEDENIINSYLPAPHPDGSPIDPSEFPSSLPAYSINVKPELRVDGEVVATGGPITMGSPERFTMTFTHPVHSTDVVKNTIQAGEYFGIAIDASGIAKAEMDRMSQDLAATKTKLEAGDFTGIAKDDILGDMLYATALSYFAALDGMEKMTAATSRVRVTRLPSAGIFASRLNVGMNIFDMPVSAMANGLVMDVDLNVKVVQPLDGDQARKKQFMLSSGMSSSSLEHSVPEQLFSTQDNPLEGVSAVKALQIANDQGIPIYTVTSANIATILPQLQVDAAVKSDIRNAVNRGKEVTVSKTNVTHAGWTGCGYLIIDTTTGSGGYMISGGLSGAYLNARVAEYALILSTTSTNINHAKYIECIMPCIGEMTSDALGDYVECTKDAVAVGIVIGVSVPSLMVLFEPYLLPVLLPTIALATTSTSVIGIGLCTLRFEVIILSGALGCMLGCGGY